MHATAVQGGVKLLRQLTLTRGDADAIAAGAPGLLALLNDEGQVTGGGQLTHHMPSLQQGRAVHAGSCTILHCALLMACTHRAPELSSAHSSSGGMRTGSNASSFCLTLVV